MSSSLKVMGSLLLSFFLGGSTTLMERAYFFLPAWEGPPAAGPPKITLMMWLGSRRVSVPAERLLLLDELLNRPSPRVRMKVFKQPLSHWSTFLKALQLLSTLLFIGEFVERGSGREISHRRHQMFQRKTEVGNFGNSPSSPLSFLAL